MIREKRVVFGLECCVKKNVCTECPYTGRKNCMDRLMHEALDLLADRYDEQGNALWSPSGTNATGAQSAPPPPQPPESWTRERILDRARDCVCGQREQDYGSPEDNFGLIAKLWSAYMGAAFTPVDVAMLMALLKAARIKSGTGTLDSFVDGCGYFACGGEIAGKSTK